LPGDLSVPVLVVQHMPPVFTASLAQSLNQKSRLEVVEAQQDQQVRVGQVLIAPGGRHMIVSRVSSGSSGALVRVGLIDDPPENSCRPSVDVLFRSVALAYGRNVLAVVMTGMGEDGMRGVKALKERGCYCITQDAASCTIYGMPRAVDQANLSDESVTLKLIAPRIAALARADLRV
jgi:two-component system chemotaxis response regulator CheB